MLCVVALIVFGFLGIFSARHRVLAKEAFDCVFRRLTLRKCETGLDKRIKNKLTGSMGRKHPSLARFLYKYFEVFSWIFIILLVWSLYEIALGGYNYAVYGSCIAPGDDGVCLLNLDEAMTRTSGISAEYPDEQILPNVGDSPSLGEGIEVFVFGCYTCPYTIQAEPKLQEVIDRNDAKFIFKDFPIPTHRNAIEYAVKAKCAEEQDLYFEARELLFEQNSNLPEHLDLAEEEYNICIESEETEEKVMETFEEGINAHVTATPTFFVEEEIISGARDRDMKRLEEAIQNAQS